MLLPYEQTDKLKYLECQSANVSRIVSDVTKVDISNLMDDLHQEYINHCHDKNKEASFDKTNLPDSYGGSVDLLLGYRTFRPEVLFESETGIVLSAHPFLSPGGHTKLMVGGVLPNSSSLMPSALLTDVTSTDESSSDQTEEQSGAPPLTHDEDDVEDEIYQSSDEEADKERESLVTNIPEQTILASLMEGKTPHQKCDECSIPKDGESQYTESHPVKIFPSGLTIRRLGSAEIISSLRYDHATSCCPDFLVAHFFFTLIFKFSPC